MQEKKCFNQRNVVNLFIVSELHIRSRDLKTDFTPGDFLFPAAKLTKNADVDKYGYSVNNIGFNACSGFSLANEMH